MLCWLCSPRKEKNAAWRRWVGQQRRGGRKLAAVEFQDRGKQVKDDEESSLGSMEAVEKRERTMEDDAMML